MKKLFYFLFLFSLLFTSHSVFAANLSFKLDNSQFKTGEIVTSIFYLDTEGESINTVEGDIKYDEQFLKIERINVGNSFISFWVEKPDSETLGVIHFAGIVPGGVSTKQGEIFRVFFRALATGNTRLEFMNTSLFLNDGQGSVARIKLANTSIEIIKGEYDISPLEIKDTNPPEKFPTIRTKYENIYDNKYFAVFSTTDKETGIDYYKICEFWSCMTGESPYFLKYQNPFYYIVVYAYDVNGNVRDSVLISPYLLILLFTLSLVCIIIYFYRRYLPFYKV